MQIIECTSVLFRNVSSVGAKLALVHVLAQVHGLGRADGPCRLRLRDLVRLHLRGQVSEGQQVSDGGSLQAQ